MGLNILVQPHASMEASRERYERVLQGRKVEGSLCYIMKGRTESMEIIAWDTITLLTQTKASEAWSRMNVKDPGLKQWI